jgi:hypothetical protein
MTTHRAKHVPRGRLSVCDGRTCVGHVELIDGRWRATAIDDEVIGTFTSQREAVRSLPGMISNKRRSQSEKELSDA